MTLRPHRLPKWLQYSGLAIAGSLSFYVATLASGSGDAASEEADLLVRPTGPKFHQPSTAQQLALAITPEQRQPLQVGVRQDAFAPLNPTVTIEQLTAPLVSFVPVKKQPAIAPAPEQPPVFVGPPVPPPPVVIPAPTAPPLPFKVTGALQGDHIGDGQRTVFLSSNGRTASLVVKAGDLIDSTYRVTAITDRQIDFVYLPLQTPQSLPLDK